MPPFMSGLYQNGYNFIHIPSLPYTDSDLIFRRTLIGYYAEGMPANFG